MSGTNYVDSLAFSWILSFSPWKDVFHTPIWYWHMTISGRKKSFIWMAKSAPQHITILNTSVQLEFFALCITLRRIQTSYRETKFLSFLSNVRFLLHNCSEIYFLSTEVPCKYIFQKNNIRSLVLIFQKNNIRLCT